MNNNKHRTSHIQHPTTAIFELLKIRGVSSYSFQKRGIMYSGSISNASYEDISNLKLGFFMKLAKGLNMKVSAVVGDLVNLQKKYPPIIKHRNYKMSVSKQIRKALQNRK